MEALIQSAWENLGKIVGVCAGICTMVFAARRDRREREALEERRRSGG